jgi:predicted NBD/HSP70 family sugar kinase
MIFRPCGSVGVVTAPLMNPAGTPIRQASVRAHNLALVLRHVANSESPISRAALATATGLTRATVSALVDDLVAGSLLTGREPLPQARAGRPAVGLVIAADGAAGLGLQINVDYLAACVLDLTGAVRHRVVLHADQRPAAPEAVLAGIGRLAGEARARAAADGLPLAGAALAVPGLVGADGVVRRAANLDWYDVDAPALLRATGALGDLPLAVDNGANLAALGELRTGGVPAGFVYISGEVGIGAGIVFDGALFRGVRGWSGEIGHITVDPDGPLCRCGARGCLEQYAGQEAILQGAAITGPDAACTDVANLATAGDPAARTSLAMAGGALGTAVATVVNLLDVDTIVLGGIYAPLLPWLRAPIERAISRRVLTAAFSPVMVHAATLGADATMIGAAGAVLQAVHDDPARWLGIRPRGGG